MDHDPSRDPSNEGPGVAAPGRPRARAAVSIGLAVIFAILCGLPYLRWLEHPSLFHDDFMRVNSLRNTSLGEALFRPFNEHMAPLFETVSYLAWVAAGRQILAMPMAFMVASFIAFAATIAMLGAVIHRETGSMTSVLVAVALFSLSSVSAETVLWYSASSFQWAAAASLGAWYCAASSLDSRSPRVKTCWLLASALASLAAPAFSAIGILAAPLASLRLLAQGGRVVPTLRAVLRASIPAAGLAMYLLVCAAFRYRDVLTNSLSKNLELGAALWATARAPAWVLLPSLLGMPDLSMTASSLLAAIVSIILLVASIWWCWRSRHWPLIVGGLTLIVGGYLLTYAARAHPGDVWIFKISRYHLFPQLGLICILIATFGGFLRKLDRRPARGVFVATLLAAVLAPLQYGGMKLAAEGPYRHPDQPRLISAAARLEAITKVQAITFDEAFWALGPLQPRWSPHPWPFHPILFLLPLRNTSAASRPYPVIRQSIIASLSPEDRGIIFGGMEATTFREPASTSERPEAPMIARLVATSGITRAGQGRFDAREGLAYLEYQVDPAADDARALSLPDLKTDEWPVEVWWAGPSEPWTSERSVRWKPDPAPTSANWAVPLDAVPHWRRGGARRLRIVAGGPGKIFVGEPVFLR